MSCSSAATPPLAARTELHAESTTGAIATEALPERAAAAAIQLQDLRNTVMALEKEVSALAGAGSSIALLRSTQIGKATRKAAKALKRAGDTMTEVVGKWRTMVSGSGEVPPRKRSRCGGVTPASLSKTADTDLPKQSRELQNQMAAAPQPKTKPKGGQADKNGILFNSKSGSKFRYLSNFFGGAEISYMTKRFNNAAMKRFIQSFHTVNATQFVKLLKLLQPGKQWTAKKTKYWFDGAKPIRGILAKLVGGIVKDTPTMKRRAKVIADHLQIPLGQVLDSNHTAEAELIGCVRDKYKIKRYRDLLLSTEALPLHERPMRGKGDHWTFGPAGGDAFGKMLMKVRQEIRDASSSG